MSLNDDRRARAHELHAQRWSLRRIAASPDVEGGDRATLYGSPAAVANALAAHRTATGRGRLLDERDRDVATIDALLDANTPIAATGDRDATRNVTALLDQRARLCGYRASDDPERAVERHDAAVAEQGRADALAALDAIAPSDAQRATFAAHLAWHDARRRALAGAPRGTAYAVPAPPTLTGDQDDTRTTPAITRDRIAAFAVPDVPAAA